MLLSPEINFFFGSNLNEIASDPIKWCVKYSIRIKKSENIKDDDDDVIVYLKNDWIVGLLVSL